MVSVTSVRKRLVSANGSWTTRAGDAVSSKGLANTLRGGPPADRPKRLEVEVRHNNRLLRLDRLRFCRGLVGGPALALTVQSQGLRATGQGSLQPE
jgi:hypothetical protein